MTKQRFLPALALAGLAVTGLVTGANAAPCFHEAAFVVPARVAPVVEIQPVIAPLPTPVVTIGTPYDARLRLIEHRRHEEWLRTHPAIVFVR